MLFCLVVTNCFLSYCRFLTNYKQSNYFPVMSTIHFCSENCSSAGKSQWISSNHAMLTIKSPSLPILMLSLKKVVRVDVCSLFSSTKASNILANRQIMSHKLCWLLDMFPFISCRDFHKNLLLWSQTVYDFMTVYGHVIKEAKELFFSDCSESTLNDPLCQNDWITKHL